MKKIFGFLALVCFIASISSCKMHEKCPAYGKVSKTSKEVKI